jgi:hypothetical protein
VLVSLLDDVQGVIWQCRIRVPILNRYVRKGTKTKDLVDAINFVDDEYAVTLHKQQKRCYSFYKTLNEVADELLLNVENDAITA